MSSTLSLSDAVSEPVPDPGDPSVRTLPTRAQVRAAIPSECFRFDPVRAVAALAVSLLAVAVPTVLAALFVPMAWAWAPVWVLHAAVVGTAATGVWVVAHECGHGAFCSNGRIQDSIGFVLHSALLVPYFSWQRSHAVHHRFTNHLTDGETHVPKQAQQRPGRRATQLRHRLGPDAFAVLTIAKALLVGWPAYLIAGVSGSPARGRSNHFWPVAPFATELFPPRWRRRVWASAAGVLATLAALVGWAVAAGSIVPVVLLYVGPYLGVNAWLVTYTWLQHTDVDVPHLAAHEWTWLRGALQTVDRPYGRVLDTLHHRIGSTHVVHHVDHRIPHYRAAQATAAVNVAFPGLVRHDPTPVHRALWRVGRDCVAVQEHADGWYFDTSADRPTPAQGVPDRARSDRVGQVTDDL